MNDIAKTGDVELSPALDAALKVFTLSPVTDAMNEIAGSMTSGGHCIRSSLIVRDYLVALGFAAKVRSVGLVIRAWQYGRELHSAGVGVRAMQVAQGYKPPPVVGGGWDGHLVVVVDDREQVLIDPSIGQARRPQWSDLPSMIIAPTIAPGNRHKVGGAMAVVTNTRPAEDYRMMITWLPNFGNKVWQDSPEAAPDRRDVTVRDLVDIYTQLNFK